MKKSLKHEYFKHPSVGNTVSETLGSEKNSSGTAEIEAILDAVRDEMLEHHGGEDTPVDSLILWDLLLFARGIFQIHTNGLKNNLKTGEPNVARSDSLTPRKEIIGGKKSSEDTKTSQGTKATRTSF